MVRKRRDRRTEQALQADEARVELERGMERGGESVDCMAYHEGYRSRLAFRTGGDDLLEVPGVPFEQELHHGPVEAFVRERIRHHVVQPWMIADNFAGNLGIL